MDKHKKGASLSSVYLILKIFLLFYFVAFTNISKAGVKGVNIIIIVDKDYEIIITIYLSTVASL